MVCASHVSAFNMNCAGRFNHVHFLLQYTFNNVQQKESLSCPFDSFDEQFLKLPGISFGEAHSTEGTPLVCWAGLKSPHYPVRW